MLILQTLPRNNELHGFEIAENIQRVSGDILQVEEGSLYPALQRMLMKGWLTAEWGKTAENRRARYYRLTKASKKQLSEQLKRYERTSQAIARRGLLHGAEVGRKQIVARGVESRNVGVDVVGTSSARSPFRSANAAQKYDDAQNGGDCDVRAGGRGERADV